MNEQTLFAEALERTDPRDRAAFLDQACQGDLALRARIERLLAQHEHAGDFLQSPPHAPQPTVDEPASERPGTVIGPYKLLEQIGEGGIVNLCGTATVTNSTLSSNQGGAIFNYGGGTLIVSGCTLSGNTATSAGGGIYNLDGTVAVSGSMFCNNTPDNIFGAYTDGGGNTFC
jgi:hypothetical protein